MKRKILIVAAVVALLLSAHPTKDGERVVRAPILSVNRVDYRVEYRTNVESIIILGRPPVTITGGHNPDGHAQ